MVKYFNLNQKFALHLAAKLCENPMNIKFGSNKKNSANGFCYMFECIGGYQARFWKVGDAASDKAEDAESLNGGYDYIQKNAPISNKESAQTLGMRMKLADSTSPIRPSCNMGSGAI